MAKITKGQVYAIIESLGKAKITKGQVYAIIDDYRPPLRPRRIVSFTRWVDHSKDPKRYWRLLVLATIGYKVSLPSNEYAGLRYLGMAENTGDPDIIDPALYLTNGAASPTPTGEDGRNVFRGPTQTSTGVVRADSNGLHWFRWDFGSGTSKTISEIILGTRSGYYGQQPARFVLQSSVDDSTWTDVFTVDLTGDETYVPYKNRDFRFSAAPKPADPGSLNPHRYWRVRVKTFFDSDYICINSAKFYTDTAFANPIPNTGAVFNASSWIEGSPTNGFSTGNCIGHHYETPWVMEAYYPTPVLVNGFSMFSRSAYGQAPKNMAIDYSDDGQNWYEAWNIGEQTAWGSSEQRFFAREAEIVPGGDSTTPLIVPQ